jgi:hypothetical protein
MSPRPQILRLLRQHAQQTRVYSSAPRLVKPTKFTPPSHPSRRVSDPINYPGPPVNSSPTKHYPETMPPPESWAYWALTNRRLHFYLSLSILFVLAGTVSINNFLTNNPFGRMVEWDWSHPGKTMRNFVIAWQLSIEAESARVKEARKRLVEEVEKRGEYRKAHGLEQVGNEGGFGGWSVKSKEEDIRERGKQVLVDHVLAEQAGKEGEAEK